MAIAKVLTTVARMVTPHVDLQKFFEGHLKRKLLVLLIKRLCRDRISLLVLGFPLPLHNIIVVLVPLVTDRPHSLLAKCESTQGTLPWILILTYLEGTSLVMCRQLS